MLFTTNNSILLDGKEQLELGRQFVLRVEPIGEVDSSDATIGVNLHAKSLDIIGSICTSGKIAQIELDLIPSFVQPHRHGTNERFDARSRLIIGCAEASLDVLVIQDLHFKCEVLFQLYVTLETICFKMSVITFFMIITKKGNLIPRVFCGSAGHVTYVVLTLVDMISSTLL